ncbi:mandelate racemase/muconate lactonizing enzyme family protein [Niabella hirudinis]|uniref:mandelate racemase/muconate lactonizing enzyme family protein n=1 Tax=Niabella hirudinis TaxID=1285929 RepID=UPI003EC0F347
MQALTITKIDFYKLFIPLKEPFVISLGPLYNAESVVVRMETSAGITGWGECSPFMSINGESADTGLVVGRYFEQVLLGKDPLDIGERVADMDRVIYANHSIKSAFDMALYDIAARHAGQPLYRFLGGSPHKEIVTDYTVSVGTPEKMAADALKIQEAGFPVIKVKIGKGGAQDVERIKAIRQAVGNEIPLRVDANQGWQVAEAIETLQALAPFNIQHCEEPIARRAFMELPAIRTQSPIPIMADETCGDQYDLKRLLALGACDRINIKLGKSGGIYNALQMIRLAEAAHVEIQLGAFLESRLAMTAFAHLALCSPNIVYFDFDTALMFSQDPVEGGIQYEKNGRITVPDQPGIGAAIAPGFLIPA